MPTIVNSGDRDMVVRFKQKNGNYDANKPHDETVLRPTDSVDVDECVHTEYVALPVAAAPAPAPQAPAAETKEETKEPAADKPAEPPVVENKPAAEAPAAPQVEPAKPAAKSSKKK